MKDQESPSKNQNTGLILSIFASAALWAIALYLPAYRTSTSQAMWSFGTDHGLGGLTVFITGFFIPGWYANITMGLAYIGLIFNKPALGLLSVIGSAFLSISAIGIDSYGGPTPGDIVGVGGGFYLWLIAVNLPSVVLFVRALNEPTPKQQAEELKSEITLLDDDAKKP